MDYDDSPLPRGYDRARSRSPEVLASWMSAVAEQTSGDRPVASILDLGCGTGRFTRPLHARFGARVIGIDPSKSMLRHALEKWVSPDVSYIQARGEHIPLRDESVDLVFMSMVFHHFDDPLAVARESYRILEEGGCAFLRTGTAERVASYAITPFFPAALPVMGRVFASLTRIVDTFEKAGFLVAVGAMEQEIASTHASFVDQLRAGGDSILAQLELDEITQGIAACEAYAATVDPKPVTELIDFVSLRKPA